MILLRHWRRRTEAAEYIEREALFRVFENAEPDIMADYGPEYGSEWGFNRDAIREVINSLPTADVVPVVHGRWEDGNELCPICKKSKFNGLEADIWADWKPKCCPNCGAKMDGGKNNGL